MSSYAFGIKEKTKKFAQLFLSFTIVDISRRKIHLSRERWQHITKIHSEMSNYLYEIRQTIENPLRITPHEKGDLKNYYLYLKHRKHPEKYLKVIIKYLNEHGFIVTAHFVRYIR